MKLNMQIKYKEKQSKRKIGVTFMYILLPYVKLNIIYACMCMNVKLNVTSFMELDKTFNFKPRLIIFDLCFNLM